jgi:catechol 2,3-dioxygenase-like lactoylglutathione lyase family enzyme
MKRLHIHIKTKDLNHSVAFYTAMFGQAPSKLEGDYAKWLLDDPCANVSLSSHGGEPGVDHAGISIDTREELDMVADRLRANGDSLLAEEETTCCYAQSNKFWARDPQGAVWELFQTFGETENYGGEPDREIFNQTPPSSNASSAPKACCTPN